MVDVVDVRQVTEPGIPTELRDRDQWLLWSSESDRAKKPLNADGYGASWTDPGEWLTYEEARDFAASSEEFNGVGFVVSESDPYLALDLDGCLSEPGTLETKDWLPEIEPFTDTFMEFSASGTGIHVFAKGQELPEWWTDSHFSDSEHEGVEAYSEKFIALTGDRLEAAADSISEVPVDQFLSDAYEAVNGESPCGDDGTEPDVIAPSASTESQGYNGPKTSTDGEPDLHDVLDPSEYPSERRVSHPFHGSGTGANFKVKAGREIAYCYRHDCTLRGPHLWAIREGILRCSEVDRRGNLRGNTTWREIYDALRSDGWDVPEPGGPDSSDGGTDSESAAEPAPSQETARDRCLETVHTVVREGHDALVDAIPSLGKSYASAVAPASADEPVTYLTHLDANREDAIEDAREADLNVHKIARAVEECPVLAGRCDESEGWTELFKDLYGLGVRPKEIHERHPDSPCQSDQTCPYLSALKFDAPEVDLIVGSPVHAHMARIVEGRAVIFDENPMQALETIISGPSVKSAVEVFLGSRKRLDAATLSDLLDYREHPDRKARLLEEIGSNGNGELREDWLARTDGVRPEAPAIAYGTIAADDLGNGFERATLPDGSVFVRNSETGKVTIRRKPDLSDAHAVIGLDGTPFPEQWRNLLGVDMERERVMSDGERRSYLSETIGNSYVQTTDNVIPCSGGRWINEEESTRLLRWIEDSHGEEASLITSLAALREVVDGGDGPAAEYVDGTMWYNSLKGSNDFEDVTLGVVLGSPSLPDEEVKRQAALDGRAIEREDTPADFGPTGNQYLHANREARVGQAALRFGRNEEAGGATVYVHTSAVPEWLPVEREEPPSEGELSVMLELAERGRVSSGEIADAAGLTKRHARSCLSQLASTGIAERVGSGPATMYVHRSAPES